jgi:hypothetical protein
MADPGENGDLIGFELHTRATAVAESTTGKIRVEIGKSERQTRGHSLEDHDEGLAMGFTSGQVAQHPVNLPAGGVPPEDSSILRVSGRASKSLQPRQKGQRCRTVELARSAIMVPAARYGPNGNG